MSTETVISGEVSEGKTPPDDPELASDRSPYQGTVLETVGVVIEPVKSQQTPASQIPHTVPTRSGEGYAQIQDDEIQEYFYDE